MEAAVLVRIQACRLYQKAGVGLGCGACPDDFHVLGVAWDSRPKDGHPQRRGRGGRGQANKGDHHLEKTSRHHCIGLVENKGRLVSWYVYFVRVLFEPVVEVVTEVDVNVVNKKTASE